MRRSFIEPLALTLTLSLIGCQFPPPSRTQIDPTPKLYVLDCGSLTFDDVTAFGLANDETSVRTMFVPCYLIDHQGKQLLWDGGLPLGVVGQGAVALPTGGTMTYARSVVDQLDEIGFTPRDIEFVAFSHFHFDHVGAANVFTDSTLLIQSAEYDAAFNHAEDYEVYNAALYEKLRNTPRQLLEGDHDVFGDGQVTIYSAPGHTPGHQTLLVTLNQTGPVMLSGDLYHFEASRRLKRVPVFNTDSEQTLASMARIENILKEQGATLWIEHNAALARTLRKAPAFYE